MRIRSLEVDGYGVWSGLTIGRIADGANVLYGPNEAGKSTLLQFIRSMLYGFSPGRRKYLPPVHGGRPGGRIEVLGPNGHFQIERHDDADGRPGGEEVLLTAADGTRQGEHIIKVLLSNVDETVFNNVFAVGLREMQELGTLSDSEAAQLLYNLTAGLDRVSLVEVMRELETSRNRVLDRGGGPCQVVQLLADREKLQREIEELESLPRRYAQLASQRGQLDREIARLEEERNHAAQQVRVVELAIGLREQWLRRTGVEKELAELGGQPNMPAGAAERLERLNARLKKREERIGQLDGQRQELRKEAAGLKFHEAIARQAARIEALREQEPWIKNLQGQVGELEKEIGELQTSLAGEHQRLGLDGAIGPAELPAFSPRTLRRLRSPGRALRQRQQRAAKIQRETAVANEAAQAVGAQLEAALAGRQDRELAPAMDRAGNLVAQLRRRMQIDERLEQMNRCESELDEQQRRLLDHQLLPAWVLVGLGATFVLGAVLVLAGLFMPTGVVGSLGMPLALLGVAGVVAAVAGKVMLERSSARQLDSCRKQIEMLQLQIKQAKEDRDVLDGQLPRGGGPMASRLAAAEKDLEALEALSPLETRYNAARQEAAVAAQRAGRLDEDLTLARRRWRDALTAAGLPGKLAPRQLAQLIRRCEQIGQFQRRLAHRKEELDARRRELELLAGRIVQLAAEAKVEVTGQPVEQLRQLAEALARQQAQIARRETIRRQSRLLRRKRARYEESISRLRQQRRELLREAGARDEEELRSRAATAARAETLRREHDGLEQEITAAIAGHCPQEAIRQQLENTPADRLPARRDEQLARLAAVEKQLHERFECRGQLAEQMKVLAEDRQMAQKQLELATLETRLEEAAGRWQVLAVTGRVLETIRTAYENERQPETLREASGYLERLTQGRYCRVWTPLGENVLRVDDAAGHWLPVEALSRGTREQLFLSLRLALAACYARRGAPLPLVLDDVLVNFDADRAKAAAGVLRDFAAAGHQLLVFTCHEHILRLFKALKTPAGQLPDHAEAAHAPVMLEEPPRDKPKRARAAPASAPAPRKAASRAKPVEPEEPEEPEDELSDELDEDAEEEDERLWESEEEGDEEAAAEDDADLWDEEDTDDDDEDAGIFGAYRLD